MNTSLKNKNKLIGWYRTGTLVSKDRYHNLISSCCYYRTNPSMMFKLLAYSWKRSDGILNNFLGHPALSDASIRHSNLEASEVRKKLGSDMETLASSISTSELSELMAKIKAYNLQILFYNRWLYQMTKSWHFFYSYSETTHWWAHWTCRIPTGSCWKQHVAFIEKAC